MFYFFMIIIYMVPWAGLEAARPQWTGEVLTLSRQTDRCISPSLVYRPPALDHMRYLRTLPLLHPILRRLGACSAT